MSFSTKLLLPTKAVCSDWLTDPVHCDWSNTTSRIWNVMPVSIIASFSFQKNIKTVNNVLSFTVSSSREGNRVTWQTVLTLVCVCTQAAIKKISDALYTVTVSLSLSLTLSLTHTDTHTHTSIQNRQIVIAKSELPPPRFTKAVHSFSLSWLLQHYYCYWNHTLC